MRPLNHQPACSNAALKSMLPAIERNKLDMNSLVTLFEHFPLGILISETNDKCLYRNPAYQLMLGQDVNDPVMHSDWFQQITESHRKKINASWRQRINELKQLHLDVEMQRSGGQVFWACVQGLEVSVSEQRCISIFMFEDISERILTSNALLVAQHQLYLEKVCSQVALDTVGDAVITVNLQGQIISLNAVAEAMTGWSRKSAIGLSLVKVFKIMDTHSRTPAKNPADEAIQKNHKVVLQRGHTLISRQGKETALEDSASPIHDNHGAVIGAVLVFHHEVRSKAMLSKMTQLAWYDYLTGLPNYALFTERLTQAIAMAERHHRRMAVLFMDMDGFKRINDSLGHLWGDLLLKSVAHKLQTCVRHTDTVCRRSGDEFLIMLGEIESPEDAIKVAEQILSVIAETCDLNGIRVNLTASIGISVFPDESSDSDKLLENSDSAMFEAKRRGSNRYFYPGSRVQV